MLLVDTSVWVEIFRRPARLTLADVADLDEIVTCLPIVQEVLQGFRDERAYRVASEAFMSFAVVDSPLPADRFVDAANLDRSARRAGFTVRSSTDCLIAASALRHQLPIVHRARDYAMLARVSPLRESQIR